MIVECHIENCDDRFRSSQARKCVVCERPMCDVHASADGTTCVPCVIEQVRTAKPRRLQPIIKTRGTRRTFRAIDHVRPDGTKRSEKKKRVLLVVGGKCGKGHELTEETLKIRSDGKRRCGECEVARNRRHYLRQKERRAAGGGS